MKPWVAVLPLMLITAQSEQTLEARLKKFGDRTYQILEKGNPVGKFTLKTRITEEEGVTLAVFEDKMEKGGDAAQTVEYVEKAGIKTLRLRWATRVDGGIKEDDPTIAMEDQDAHVTSDQGNLILRKAEGAVGERALIRLVCLQKQEVGNVLKTNLLVLDPVDYQRDQEIKCVARDTIEVNGKKVEACRWVDKREGKSVLSGQPIPYKFENTYWVTAEGSLVKFKSGPLEMVLESK